MILSPGATIGILGSGQLGRMLAIAALKVGLRTHIFAPEDAAPAYDASASSGAATPAPSCSAASDLSASGLDVTPRETGKGFGSNNVGPDNALAGQPSTPRSTDRASTTATVLLPMNRAAQLGFAPGQRLVLGPVEMTNTSVGAASAHENQTGQWVVDYTTTAAGAHLWDRVTRQSFHGFLGIELNGIVYSAPIIQPTQLSFTSFGGRGEISGNLTKTAATRLANGLTDHAG